MSTFSTDNDKEGRPIKWPNQKPPKPGVEPVSQEPDFVTTTEEDAELEMEA